MSLPIGTIRCVEQLGITVHQGQPEPIVAVARAPLWLGSACAPDVMNHISVIGISIETQISKFEFPSSFDNKLTLHEA